MKHIVSPHTLADPLNPNPYMPETSWLREFQSYYPEEVFHYLSAAHDSMIPAVREIAGLVNRDLDKFQRGTGLDTRVHSQWVENKALLLFKNKQQSDIVNFFEDLSCKMTRQNPSKMSYEHLCHRHQHHAGKSDVPYFTILPEWGNTSWYCG